MEIEVGEYVKLYSGNFGKIIAIKEETEEFMIDCIPSWWIDFVKIKRHSKNIIDLIEVGDIVEVQNKLDGSKTIFNLNKYIIDIYKEQIENGSIKLASILTHEMYEENCYKIGE